MTRGAWWRALGACWRLTPPSPHHECCVWVGHVLRAAWGDRPIGQGAPWPASWRGQPLADWHLYDPARPWSPVEAAVAAGLADELVMGAPGLSRPGLLVVQGWRGSTGHTFFCSALPAGDVVLVLDSTAAAGQGRASLRSVAEVGEEYRVGLASAVLRRPVPPLDTEEETPADGECVVYRLFG